MATSRRLVLRAWLWTGDVASVMASAVVWVLWCRWRHRWVTPVMWSTRPFALIAYSSTRKTCWACYDRNVPHVRR